MKEQVIENLKSVISRLENDSVGVKGVHGGVKIEAHVTELGANPQGYSVFSKTGHLTITIDLKIETYNPEDNSYSRDAKLLA